MCQKLFLVIVSLGNFLFSVSAQNKFSPHASQIQLEGLGPAGLFSINFDSRFAKKDNGLGYRIGVGALPLGIFGESCNSGMQLSVPIGLNYLIGKKNHLLEIGGGGNWAVISATKIYCPNLKPAFFSDETGSYGFLSIGYRYQPFQKKGITCRAFISPLFQKGFSPKLWGGISAGYRFNKN